MHSKSPNFQIIKSDMALTNELIIQRLKQQFGDQVSGFEEPYGMLTFEVPKDLNLEVLQFLFDDPELSFQFLTDLTAVHYPAYKGREIAVVYHLHNLVANFRIRFKIFVPIEKPDVFSATKLFASPNLIRIQNVEEMDYFPQRKEYPVEDQTRIDKDDEMFGRGGSFDFGNRQADGSPKQIPEAGEEQVDRIGGSAVN
jgi:NADH-quinone oxidoreductase subunit C